MKWKITTIWFPFSLDLSRAAYERCWNSGIFVHGSWRHILVWKFFFTLLQRTEKLTSNKTTGTVFCTSVGAPLFLNTSIPPFFFENSMLVEFTQPGCVRTLGSLGSSSVSSFCVFFFLFFSVFWDLVISPGPDDPEVDGVTCTAAFCVKERKRCIFSIYIRNSYGGCGGVRSRMTKQFEAQLRNQWAGSSKVCANYCWHWQAHVRNK